MIHLTSFTPKEKNIEKEDLSQLIEKKNTEQSSFSESKIDSIDQIKNITQEKKIKPEAKIDIKAEEKISINTFEQLLKICFQKKEMKLKYELEKNVNLVRFEKHRLEISFNDNLDKNFVKDLSLRLFEWTGYRWIITFSKEKGDISIKERERNKRNKLINNVKESNSYKIILEKFPDANLEDVILKHEQEE